MLSVKIKGFEDYIIYENGDIYSFKRYKEGKKLKTTLSKTNGYYYICLRTKDQIRFNKTLHRLIAEAFIPNPDNKPCIDHIDRNRTNNKLSNLRWSTYIENNNNMGDSVGSVYLCKNKNSEKYVFRKYINNISHSKTFKTKEEAEEYQVLFNSGLVNKI